MIVSESNEEEKEEKKVIPRLNANDAIRKIEDINDVLSKIQREFMENTGNYFYNLTKSWWSSKAISFGEDLVSKIDDIDRELIYVDESTVNDACSSFNDIAPFRNTRSIYVQAGPFIGVNYKKCEEADPSGRVGMIIKDVENHTNEYISVLESLKKAVSGIPSSIGFYDVNGSLVKTFNTKSSKINSIVNDSIDFISRKVQNATQEEIDLTEAAVQEAQSVLSQKTSV